MRVHTALRNWQHNTARVALSKLDSKGNGHDRYDGMPSAENCHVQIKGSVNFILHVYTYMVYVPVCKFNRKRKFRSLVVFNLRGLSSDANFDRAAQQGLHLHLTEEQSKTQTLVMRKVRRKIALNRGSRPFVRHLVIVPDVIFRDIVHNFTNNNNNHHHYRVTKHKTSQYDVVHNMYIM